jgi:hypothetical protein
LELNAICPNICRLDRGKYDNIKTRSKVVVTFLDVKPLIMVSISISSNKRVGGS